MRGGNDPLDTVVLVYTPEEGPEETKVVNVEDLPLYVKEEEPDPDEPRLYRLESKDFKIDPEDEHYFVVG